MTSDDNKEISAVIICTCGHILDRHEDGQCIFPFGCSCKEFKQDMNPRKLTARFQRLKDQKYEICECGQLIFSHVPEVHLDHSNDELNRMYEEGSKQVGEEEE